MASFDLLNRFRRQINGIESVDHSLVNGCDHGAAESGCENGAGCAI
jgi:hypothetical protein